MNFERAATGNSLAFCDLSHLGDPALPLLWIKSVADPRLGFDEFGRAWILFEFLADVGDEDAQIFRLLRAVAAPDGGKDRAMGENFPAICQKILNHVVLFGREVHSLAADFNQTLLRIDLEIPGFISSVGLWRRT